MFQVMMPNVDVLAEMSDFCLAMFGRTGAVHVEHGD